MQSVDLAIVIAVRSRRREQLFGQGSSAGVVALGQQGAGPDAARKLRDSGDTGLFCEGYRASGGRSTGRIISSEDSKPRTQRSCACPLFVVIQRLRELLERQDLGLLLESAARQVQHIDASRDQFVAQAQFLGGCEP